VELAPAELVAPAVRAASAAAELAAAAVAEGEFNVRRMSHHRGT
jgi:hypothetical protein